MPTNTTPKRNGTPCDKKNLVPEPPTRSSRVFCSRYVRFERILVCARRQPSTLFFCSVLMTCFARVSKIRENHYLYHCQRKLLIVRKRKEGARQTRSTLKRRPACSLKTGSQQALFPHEELKPSPESTENTLRLAASSWSHLAAPTEGTHPLLLAQRRHFHDRYLVPSSTSVTSGACVTGDDE